MAADSNLKELNALAKEEFKIYEDRFKEFLDALKDACKNSIQQVTDVKIEQAYYDIDEIKKTIESNAGQGINLLDLVFTFIPIAGGHIFEKIATSFFRNKIASRYSRSKQFTALLKEKDTIVKEMTSIDKSHTSYGMWGAELKRVNGIINYAHGDFRPKEEFLNTLLEFSTPIINDYLQQLGQEMYKKSMHKSLLIFEDYNPSNLEEISTYNKRVISRWKDSPSSIVSTYLEDAIIKEKENIKVDLAFDTFSIEMNLNESHARDLIDAYKEKSKDIPKSSALSQFKLYFSEVIEAMIWLLILGNPKKWASAYNSEWEYYKTRYMDEDSVSFYEFYFKINIPKKIHDHLLTHFRPFPENADPEIASINYLDYYTAKKKEDVKGLSSDSNVGITERMTFPGTGTLSKDGPGTGSAVGYTSSIYYTAEETAFYNLKQDFMTKYYSKASGMSVYFNSIVEKHKI